MRISDWSSDVCSSDLKSEPASLPSPKSFAAWPPRPLPAVQMGLHVSNHLAERWRQRIAETCALAGALILSSFGPAPVVAGRRWIADPIAHRRHCWRNRTRLVKIPLNSMDAGMRSEEHTSELQTLMRTSYAVYCLKKH